MIAANEITSPHLMFCSMECMVAFGDSITRGEGVQYGEGWVELLSDALKRNCENNSIPIFNAGSSGNTSSEGLQRIESEVLRHMPGFVLVGFGGNDAVHTERAVSLDKFKSNLQTIVERIRSHGGEVALITFPPIINSWHAWSAQSFYNRWGGVDQCVERYRQCTRAVAKRQSVPLFDLDRNLRALIAKKGQAAIIKSDGVHLTPDANQLISIAVWSFLQEIKVIKCLTDRGMGDIGARPAVNQICA